MDQVVQVTRNKRTGQIDGITFFEEFYAADLDEQLRHLKNLLEIAENRPGMNAESRKRFYEQGICDDVVDDDGNEQNSKPAE